MQVCEVYWLLYIVLGLEWNGILRYDLYVRCLSYFFWRKLAKFVDESGEEGPTSMDVETFRCNFGGYGESQHSNAGYVSMQAAEVSMSLTLRLTLEACLPVRVSHLLRRPQVARRLPPC